jgi:hypothetical protein
MLINPTFFVSGCVGQENSHLKGYILGINFIIFSCLSFGDYILFCTIRSRKKRPVNQINGGLLAENDPGGQKIFIENIMK